MDTSYNFHRGNAPILISIPHSGTDIPPALSRRMTPAALRLPDVDRHLPLLYNMAQALDVSILSANYARYVIDLNRPPNDTSLYPGLDTTSLCPIDTFEKEPIYLDGEVPDQGEVDERISQYWQPYHTKLQSELQRIRDQHGIAILWDAHSIASQVPRFFSGELPDLSFGSDDGKSCDASLEAAIAETLAQSHHTKTYSHVFNERFKGGYITRQYGAPYENIHSIQLEMTQRNYMMEAYPYTFEENLANQIRPLLTDLLKACLSWSKI